MPDKGKVIEGWTGPGKRDSLIHPLEPTDDGLHIDMGKRGMYEWWYFDAHLNTGHTIVIFFHAANPNPGLQGKTGIEIVLLRPDGKRIQRFIAYDRSSFLLPRKSQKSLLVETQFELSSRTANCLFTIFMLKKKIWDASSNMPLR